MNTLVEGFMPKANEIASNASVASQRAPKETPTARPIALPEMVRDQVRLLPAIEARGTQAWRPLANTEHPIHQVKATVQVYVGSATVRVGDLLNAVENQVLLLDRKVGHTVDLMLEGQVIARGELVAVDDRFALRITELPLDLDVGVALAPTTAAR